MKCPICEKKVARDDPEYPFLQRALPHHRSGKLGVREIRDLSPSARIAVPEDDPEEHG